ncbi:MAG: c-type cytochrome [Proteobacteria bacterium]|nr:c-type cytochrome [Pseudomonadota bacterium]
MERQILWCFVLTLALAIFLTVYWIFEPSRLKATAERMRLEGAERGRPLYLTHCADCHGKDGEGGTGISPLNSKRFLEEIEDDVIYKIIERGIPQTGMAPLADTEGGPLNREQIENLVAFIRDWESTAPVLEEVRGEEVEQEGAAYVGSQECLDCHEGIDEEYIAAWRNSPMTTMAYLRIKDDTDKETCYSCHTTGYDAETKTFVEKNVGCEACHGPGENYQAMMMGPEAEKGGEIAKKNARKSCVACHNPHVPTEIHAELARKGS